MCDDHAHDHDEFLEEEADRGLDRRGLFRAAGLLGIGLGVGGFTAGGLGASEAFAAPTAGWSNPALGRLTSGYKSAARPGHLGWDVANYGGTPIYATASGTVRDIFTGRTPGDKTQGPLPGRTGNSVHINHPNSLFSYYGHLTKVLVSKGQKISCGQLVGTMGTTGNSTGNHLHFEIHSPRLSTTNPRTFLSNRGISLGSTASVGSAGWPTLKSGASGGKVKMLQRLLNHWGRGLAVDGDFGSVTVAAVKTTQGQRGLVKDGEVGPITWTGVLLPVTGGNGKVQGAAQEGLNLHGYKLVVDGNFGAKSVAAAKNFQSKKGLYADGEVGPLTWPAFV